MILSGLVSVTFRALPLAEIVRLTVLAGLKGIEWGGDVHVPPGDRRSAIEAAHLCQERGLAVVSYGSYYRLGQVESDEFDDVLATCQILHAPNVRVWAGKMGSAEANVDYRAKIAADARRCAYAAATAGITVSLEFHAGTLTDTAESTVDLVQTVGAENLRTYWQTSAGKSRDENLVDIRALKGCLSNLHCHHVPGGRRSPLSEGEAEWLTYLRTAAEDRADRWALIEFVEGDAPEALMRDAAALTGWMAQLSIG